MRKMTALVGLLLLFITFSPIHAQSYTTLTPPVVQIELGRRESLPAGVDELIEWGGTGGGGGSENNITTPTWTYLPSGSQNSMGACGFGNRPLSSAVLRLPSGSRFNLSNETTDEGCWYHFIDWDYGMELGEYTVTLASSNGSLEHNWNLGYPTRPMARCFTESRSTGEDQAMLMGFSARRTIRLHFYAESEFEHYYIASRNVAVDEHGTVFINAYTTRTSPYRDYRIGFVIDGYDSLLTLSNSCGFHELNREFRDPSGEIRDLWVDHNVVVDGQKGMRVHLSLRVSDMRGSEGSAILYFYFANGTPLDDFDDRYRTVDGHVSTQRKFRSRYFVSTYSDFSIFMPYTQLHMRPGNYDLQLRAVLAYDDEFISDFWRHNFSFSSD